MHARNLILLGRHANAHRYDTIQLVASDKDIRVSDIHQVMIP
jgi:hypothetical protein